MMEFSHFYSRYGQALLYEEPSENYNEKAKELLELGLEHFRLKAGNFEGEERTTYSYARIKKGNPSKGVFLAPSITITDLKASGLWKKSEELIKMVEKFKFEDTTSIKQSIAPMTGEYNNGRSRHTPKSTLEEAVCNAITTTSIYKPCISFRGSDGKYNNYSIIPDLSVKELQTFIALFKRMLVSDASKSLFIGSVSKEEKKSNTKYTPRRPELFNGNFPNPPRSSYLATIGVIASISEWAKEAKLTTWANEVLDSLKGATLYLITYGDAKSFSYSHYVIDLAKDGKLREIIDSIFYTQLFEKSRWNYSSKEDQIEYKKFDMFASRFLQLFNRPAFNDFLAFRAEYPNELKILFTTYFTKMEKIPIEIVQSAKTLGSWLNYAAYLAAKNDKDNKTSDDIKKAKSKFLVELESSAFSARRGDALVFQVIRRAALLSSSDAPAEADLYIEKTCSGELPLDSAKNLVIAFSRLRSKYIIKSDEYNSENITQDTSDYNEE